MRRRQNPLHRRERLGVRAARNARPTVQSVVQIRSGFEYLTPRRTSCGLVINAHVCTQTL